LSCEQISDQEAKMPGKSSLPGTLKRSPAKAQRTYEKTLDHAEQEYGDGERAHRTAFAALKHSFEKVGDHWEPKEEKGPSDPRAAQSGGDAREGRGETFGGVDYYGSSKKELETRARDLGIKGRSRMDKKELARAIARKQ
jgi:cation transport regulator ChaB